LLRIEGLNLGPVEGAAATGLPLPVELGSPAVQVLINNRPAPLVSVSPDRIVCQVPQEMTPGAAALIVKRGEAQSRAVQINVSSPANPSLQSADGTGFGPAETGPAPFILLRATGMGPTDPAQPTGSSDPGAVLRLPARVLLNGRPVDAALAPSAGMAGVYEIRFDAPAYARPGDVLQVFAGGVMAPALTLGRLKSPESSFVPLPENVTGLQALVVSDLNGDLAVVNGRRGADGCYPSWVIDFANSTATALDGCPAAANPNAATPWLPPTDSQALVSFLGPTGSDPAAGISALLRLWLPGAQSPTDVVLPFAASQVVTTVDGHLRAAVGGESPRAARIDINTGEVTPLDVAPVPQQPGGGAQPAALAGILRARELDLGDGVKHVAAARQAGNFFFVVCTDSLETPTRAKATLLNARGQTGEVRPLPDGWLPLIPPSNPQRPAQLPPGTDPASLIPLAPALFDANAREAGVVVRNSDWTQEAVAVFPLGEGGVRTVAFPEGWFVAACTSSVPVFSLELTHREALFGSRRADHQFQQQCAARGYLEVELGARAVVRATAIAGDGQINVTAGASEINDYLYGTDASPDPATRNAAQTLFVLDSVAENVFPINLPREVATFVQPRPLRELNAVVALGLNRTAGDAGIVYFDLERAESRVFNVPADFDSLQYLDILPATRHLLARGVRHGAAGMQYILFDLETTEPTIVANPDGVSWVGNVPASVSPGTGQPGQGGAQPAAAATVLQRLNLKSNTLTAVAFNSARNPVGILRVRLP
jgi:uncharacterized protein (TIGR03437 family)